MTDPVKKQIATAYKGFDENMKCRGLQYEVGKKLRHDGPVEPCSSGFHACKSPLAVFNYYSPSNSRYAIVQQSESLIDDNDKTASSVIKVKAEVSIPGLVKAHIKWVRRGLIKDNQSAASVTGKESIAFVGGKGSKAKASLGGWIVVAERDIYGEILSIITGKAGVDIEPDTYYQNIDGEFAKVAP